MQNGITEYDETKVKCDSFHESHTFLSDSLDVDEIFPVPGKQGLVGLLKFKKSPKRKVVFKISQYINYLSKHEHTVIQALEKIDYCPNFEKGYGVISCKVDATVRKSGNPFDITSKYPIQKDVLLLEYIKQSKKMSYFMKSEKIEDKVLYSSIKQTLCAIKLAQDRVKFTHYDLHSNNVMMKKCDENTFVLYTFSDGNSFLFPTYGYYPVIIDYGFSYANSLDGGPLWPSMGHTSVGFTSNQFDPVCDPKLFMITVADEMHSLRKSDDSKAFKTITRNLFSCLNVEWDSGWDKGYENSASDYVNRILEDESEKSELFKNWDHYCIDILQTLIILPLEEQRFDNMIDSFKLFLTEFVKIETEVSNPFYSMYILKNIIDIAREVRYAYMKKETREKTVVFFKKSIFEVMDTVTKFCTMKDVNFEKMLCGLLYFARTMEGVLYAVSKERTEDREADYKKMPFKNVVDMIKCVDVNIVTQEKFKINDKVIVISQDEESMTEYVMSKEMCDSVENGENVVRVLGLQNGESTSKSPLSRRRSGSKTSKSSRESKKNCTPCSREPKANTLNVSEESKKKSSRSSHDFLKDLITHSERKSTHSGRKSTHSEPEESDSQEDIS